MLDLFPALRPRRGRRARARRVAGLRRWPSASARRSSSTARRRCGAGAGAPRGDGRARRLRHEGVSERRADAAAARGRDRRRCRRRRGSSRSRARPGSTGDELIVHGNNKDEPFLAEAAAVGAIVVLDAPDEAGSPRAPASGQVLVRVTLGVDADTHEAIRTGHHGSKFGLPEDQALALVADALAARARRARAARPRRLAARRTSTRRRRRSGASPRFAAPLPRRARLGAARRRPRRRLRHPPPPRRARARGGRTGCVRRRDGARRLPRGGAARAGGLARAGPLARRPGRGDAVSRRRGEAARRANVGRGRRRHVGQPATAALRRALHRAQRQRGPPSRRPRRSASPACTASPATSSSTTSQLPAPRARRPARRPGDRAPTRSSMSSNYNGVGRPAAVLVGDGAGDADPPARDGRRPARARGRVTLTGLSRQAPSATLTATITAPPSVMCATERRKLVSRKR